MLNNKKIAFVLHSLGPAGAEKVVSELSLYWQKKGYAITVILFDAKEIAYPYGGKLLDLELPSVEGFLKRSIVLLKRAWQLKKIYKKENFDLIIGIMESASFPSILAEKKTIASNHCNPKLYFSKVEWKLANLLFPKARKVVCVSKEAMHAFKERLPEQTALTYIYNPVDFSRLQTFAQQESLVKVDGTYIVAVGRLEQQKRFDRLIQAYSRTKLNREAKLLILGEGSWRAQLQQQINELNLTDKVILAGSIKNPHPNIKNSKFLVMSSDHEGFPMVLIEALAVGKPIISTDCATGPNEIIQHGHNGLLVPVDNVLALSDAMDELFFNKALYEHLSKNTMDSIKHLSIETIASAWEALAWRP